VLTVIRAGVVALTLVAACAPKAPPPPPPPVAAIPASDPAPAADEPARASPLRRLIVLRSHRRMLDCGHDGAFGAHHCAYTAAGVARPAPPVAVLHVFLTDPPALVLAATEIHPAKLLGDADAVVAECETEPLGEATGVHLGATDGVTGYLHGGAFEVLLARACNVEPWAGLPEVLHAAHVLVSHAAAQRVPPGVTRTRDEALALAADIDRALASGKLGFDEAAQRSDDAPIAARHGDLGRFRPGVMAPEFELVLLGTPIGGRSPFFESSFGFHIVSRLPP
jgi:PPIC-type peptidyl-prolyl cis-trans isomerase-like protein